ncbi:hypothetical protein [Halostagnicola sp. A-GB9-2]|uniref:hypothetical protein n=1 Tax=Halostagnicola sp. A-GB9-2 TaxID=3048066 RepID=UPI0024C0C51C|nr:hypothetical protein [Halostagnicola sp. A-GB9-2]MDJ1432293.1 hypothetical protein [Halostagnicola sp. A-GB9-2]
MTSRLKKLLTRKAWNNGWLLLSSGLLAVFLGSAIRVFVFPFDSELVEFVHYVGTVTALILSFVYVAAHIDERI